MVKEELSLSEARRLALAAQGFGRPRPSGRVGLRDLKRTIRQLCLLQIDYVNVLVPAHDQVPSSRLGPYEKSHLDKLRIPRRDLRAAREEAVGLLRPAVFAQRREARRFRSAAGRGGSPRGVVQLP
jgi:uncharacterized protein YcaQ